MASTLPVLWEDERLLRWEELLEQSSEEVSPPRLRGAHAHQQRAGVRLHAARAHHAEVREERGGGARLAERRAQRRRHLGHGGARACHREERVEQQLGEHAQPVGRGGRRELGARPERALQPRHRLPAEVQLQLEADAVVVGARDARPVVVPGGRPQQVARVVAVPLRRVDAAQQRHEAAARQRVAALDVLVQRRERAELREELRRRRLHRLGWGRGRGGEGRGGRRRRRGGARPALPRQDQGVAVERADRDARPSRAAAVTTDRRNLSGTQRTTR